MRLLLEAVDRTLSALEGVGVPAAENRLIVAHWHLAIALTIARDTDWDDNSRSLLDCRLEIPENAPEEDRKILETYNHKYICFSELQKRVLEDKLPSPSMFGKAGPEGWRKTQYTDVRILCLRPPAAKGLPLRMLHNVFRQFTLNLHKPLPKGSATADSATRVAATLCAEMGKAFDNETQRSETFDTCFFPLFSDGDRWKSEHLVKAKIDSHHGKVNRALFLLNETKSLLKEGKPHSPTSLPASTPRIYTSCTLYEGRGTQGSLTFTENISGQKDNRLLFAASLSSSKHSALPVLVKLVNEPYGEDVHRLLARHHFAPSLYGYARYEGAPCAYIMEYLQSPTWTTLYNFSRGNASNNNDKRAIRRSLQHLVGILEDNQVVHGDLRPVNIMLQVDDERKLVRSKGRKSTAKIRVVDFDWAGKAGEVLYPVLRNQDIDWPGNSGGPIEGGQDRQLVKSWFYEAFSLPFDTVPPKNADLEDRRHT
ncbi:uncharacterized protein LAESUDRAFT_794023 [Laetiporus sulphureus 93-53]|uniref:Protein kinase domain-containing protein n=1 Tax=Laetiporus sulphureus 93-53 TaxID=1314785 RepID=A0A165C4Q4_9APHY|nr:uncharacterized protein LAESUDRAFT_794023 [Laetiporus sulphureus 93-53]KZT02200.1 hypothetical protein LAESUDRAFT_794023 [Laetiporus sulphureus 93-53]